MIACLAKDCGWSYDWIYDHLSLQQILGYYENIQKAKIRELKVLGMIIGHAVAFGSGHMEPEKFTEWLLNIGKKQVIDDDMVQSLKDKGLPIEDTI